MSPGAVGPDVKDPGQVLVRPLREQDVEAVRDLSYASLRDAGRVYGWELPEPDDALRERGSKRIRHALRHDPAGAWVAEVHGAPTGVALATRRGPLWFLSLLTVATGLQARGAGRSLLDAALATRDGAAAICASGDPKALRRYRLAGFDLLPCLEARGTLDRALLPAVTSVRPGSYDDDRALVEDVAQALRGAPHGPDLDLWAAAGRTLHVTDTAAGRGYVVVGERGPVVVGATTGRAAAAMLWTALAEAGDGPLEVSWLSHAQQWALDVALAARLSLVPGGAFCTAGPVGPFAPYLPSGGWG